MGLLDDVMTIDSSVFRNQDIFNITYLPEIVQCRDKELKSIFMTIKPLIMNKKVLNTIIFGNSSTGKTTVIKHALIEIENYTNIKTCYINCNVQDTIRKCYIQIFKVLFEIPPRNSLSTEIIQEQIMGKLEQEPIILVFDDLNHLSKFDSNKVINEFFRANEFYHTNMAIIIIVNNILFKYDLEKNTQSVLQCNEILFRDYTEEEIFSILKIRCREGFKPGVITEEQIKRLSHTSVHSNDLRWGLTVLNSLGMKIESENRDKITDEDLRDYVL